MNIVSKNRLQLTLYLLIFLALLSACSEEPGLTKVKINQLISNPSNLPQFEKKHGKIGSHALPALLLQASQFIGRPFEDLKIIITNDNPEVITLTMDTPVQLSSNSFLFLAEDVVGGQAIYFDTLEFENTSGGRAVLMLEALDRDGNSQAFIYTELEVGAKYSFKHNDPTKAVAGSLARAIPGQGTTVIMKGTADGFNFATASLDAAFNPERICSLVKAKVLRNQCIGNCSSGSCKATSFESFWYFGKEPATCGC